MGRVPRPPAWGCHAEGVLRKVAAITAALMLVVGALGVVQLIHAQPLTGDWNPRQSFEQAGVRVELKRLIIRRWSEPLPKLKLLQWCQSDLKPKPKGYYFYLEFGIDIDGVPFTKGDSRLRSIGPLLVWYRGQKVDPLDQTGAYPGEDENSWVQLCHQIQPWGRGFGPGEFRVLLAINLKSGEGRTFVFHLPVN